MGGFFERVLAPRALRNLHTDELERLDRHARELLQRGAAARAPTTPGTRQERRSTRPSIQRQRHDHAGTVAALPLGRVAEVVQTLRARLRQL